MEAGVYLDSFLAPLAPYLARPEITDIYVNRPGEIWTETLGGEIVSATPQEILNQAAE